MLHTDPADAWLSAVVGRHTRALSSPEFLKAVRALSARYVERRAVLSTRSPTDSAGKRAAFAGFFAPLHFLTTRAVVRALGAGAQPISRLADLGCGTGVASAAWALECARRPRLAGIDREKWALDEAAWNWRELGLLGRARRDDLVRAAGSLDRPVKGETGPGGVVLAWSVNELDDKSRRLLLPALVALADRGTPLLVIEPLARDATPWWDDWAGVWRQRGGRADEWKFDEPLPAVLARLSEAAGFRRQALGARSLWLPGRAIP